jgi:hypothetical protein
LFRLDARGKNDKTEGEEGDYRKAPGYHRARIPIVAALAPGLKQEFLPGSP